MRGELTRPLNKAALLTALENNRERHGAAFRKAKAGYIKVTTEQMKQYLTRLANGELLERAFIPAPPEDHTGDYDDAIDMLSFPGPDDTIELTQQQFKQYVKDDWGWKDSWVTSNTTYLEA
jgi:hypothetical protein